MQRNSYTLKQTYPRQERKSTLPVVSIAVGMRLKNKNTVKLKYCGINPAYLGHEHVLEITVSVFDLCEITTKQINKISPALRDVQ